MVHVLGAGSLGMLWAARLALHAVPVTLVMRDQAAAEAWNARGGCVQLQQGDRTSTLPVPAQPGMAKPSAAQQGAIQPIECLIVATKAYSALAAIESIEHRLAPGAQVVMLQNGLGAQLQARQRWPQLDLLFASITDGAWTDGPGRVVWAGRGLTRIGSPAGGEARPWLDTLTRCGFDWQWEADIQAVLWHKLAVNCAINPLSVIHDCSNGEVATRAGKDFEPLLNELDQLLAAVGAQLPPGELFSRVHAVIRQTAANSSSMRQDVAAGRRTEVDFILGHAVRTARESMLQLPRLEGLLNELRALLGTRGLPTD